MAKFVKAPSALFVDQDMAADFRQIIPSTLQADVVGIQLNYDGADPAGVLTLEGSLDGGLNWVALPLTVNGSAAMSITIPTSTSPILFDIVNTSVPLLSVNFVADGGGSEGTMNGFFTYKRLGE